jgi:hypothetical protein
MDVVIFPPSDIQWISWEKTLFFLKIVAIFMKCKAQPHMLYLIGAFLSQKEKGKTLLGFKPKYIGNLSHHFFTLKPSQCQSTKFPPNLWDYIPTFFHFLVLCSGSFFSRLFLANFQHLATKNKSSANHTKDFCEKNPSKLSYFKGFLKKKSPYIHNAFQQVATKLFSINFFTSFSYL